MSIPLSLNNLPHTGASHTLPDSTVLDQQATYYLSLHDAAKGRARVALEEGRGDEAGLALDDAAHYYEMALDMERGAVDAKLAA